MDSKRSSTVTPEECIKKSRLSDRKSPADKGGEVSGTGTGVKADGLSDEETGALQCTYKDKDFIPSFAPTYQNDGKVGGIWKDGEVQLLLHKLPYKCCELSQFIRGEAYLKQLKTDLGSLEFYPKNNDLYKFEQSDDLKTVSKSSIQHLRKILYTDFRAWLQEVTGISLNDTVDMSCSAYKSTDTLLCHDDELEGRRIAFILYLVPQWAEKDGGMLDLFAVDEQGKPSEVVKSIVPEWNKLIFFEVTPVSFHQVSEVLSEDKCRLSVSGWFHGPPIERPEPHCEVSLPLEPCLTIEEQLFYQWINFEYLDVQVQAEIQAKFEAESEIELHTFINPQMYASLRDAMNSSRLVWKKRGPPNKRCYFQLDPDSYPSILVNCVQFFRSDALFIVLSNLTGLSLHKLAINNEESKEKLKEQPSSSSNADEKEESDQGEQPTSSSSIEQEAHCRGEVRCWRPGCYTLISDNDTEENAEFTLDAAYFVGCEDWQPELFGGYTSYITKDKDEELLTVNPEPNSLALVYKDSETLQFVKHLNHNASQREFYDLSFVYCEINS